RQGAADPGPAVAPARDDPPKPDAAQDRQEEGPADEAEDQPDRGAAARGARPRPVGLAGPPPSRRRPRRAREDLARAGRGHRLPLVGGPDRARAGRPFAGPLRPPVDNEEFLAVVAAVLLAAQLGGDDVRSEAHGTDGLDVHGWRSSNRSNAHPWVFLGGGPA